MKCPKCQTSLKKINVKVQDAKTKAISYQCGKCGWFRFEPKSAERVIKELKKPKLCGICGKLMKPLKPNKFKIPNAHVCECGCQTNIF